MISQLSRTPKQSKLTKDNYTNQIISLTPTKSSRNMTDTYKVIDNRWVGCTRLEGKDN